MKNSEPKIDVVIGIHPILEALKANKPFDKIWIQENLKKDGIDEIKAFIKKRGISKLIVPREKLNNISKKNHQGVMGFLSPIEFQNIEDILPSLFEQDITPFILVLDKISDVRNFGAITRTAECAGVHCIIIPKKGSAQLNTDAIKTSAGALFKIPICKSTNIRETGLFLKDSGLKIVAATEKGYENYIKVDYRTPLAIVLGSEEKGISFDLLGLADHKVSIPVKGTVESLNVSVAAGIIMYEALKQRERRVN